MKLPVARIAAEPLVLLLCVLTAALEGYDIQAFGVAAPRLIVDMHLSASQTGLAGSAAMLGMVAGSIAGGPLAERFSIRGALVASTLAFALCSLLTAAAQSTSGLMIARLGTGVGLGAAMPNLLAVATRLRPNGRHAGIATTIFCGMPAGGALVAACAGWLGEPLPWRALFFIGGGAPLVVGAALAILLPPFVALPAANKTQASGLLRLLIGHDRGLTTAGLWTAFLAALLLLYLLLNWLPLLTLAKGFTAAEASRAALVFNLCGIVAALLSGRIADLFGFRLPIWSSVVMFCAGLSIILTSHTISLLLTGAGAMGAAIVSMQYLLYAASPLPYPGTRSLAAAGVAIGVGRFGSIAGPLLAGVARGAGMSVNDLLLSLLPIAILVGLGVSVAFRRDILLPEVPVNVS